MINKEDNEDFENSVKCWICDNDYFDTDAKVRDHCHITGKFYFLNINLLYGLPFWKHLVLRPIIAFYIFF